MSIHKTVLLKEAVDTLNIESNSVVVDATLGGGGHSIEILKKISPQGKLISIDRDEIAVQRFEEKLKSLGMDSRNVILVNDNFSNIGEILDNLKIEKVDAILADFGLSSDQLDNDKRGFSFLSDSRLDMRMDQSQDLDAFFVVNEYSFADLERIIRVFGDERFSKRIARAIEEKREGSPISTTKELADIVKKSIPKKYQKEGIHPATKVFQAIRIEVNNEIESINEFLESAVSSLGLNGRLAVISFHSGEDRVVKDFFKNKSRGCVCPKEFPVCNCGHESEVKIITRKPIIPSDEEVKENPRSRSAKLRVVEKIK